MPWPRTATARTRPASARPSSKRPWRSPMSSRAPGWTKQSRTGSGGADPGSTPAAPPSPSPCWRRPNGWVWSAPGHSPPPGRSWRQGCSTRPPPPSEPRCRPRSPGCVCKAT
ncbi:hypothetical protein ACFFX0_23545 [Citricoccus parietis]|uniref:Uncharacterized protein n=1 Tax=Citricoccus parietis TaxID=592307 RepID=A0ABV5G533_9MICC